jgi:hypothetical protein
MLPKKVRNKHIERLKRQENNSFYYSSSVGGMSCCEADTPTSKEMNKMVSKSSSDVGGSNSANTSKDFS